MNIKIKNFKLTLAFLTISPVVGFLKPLLVSIIDGESQFGNYTLAIAYSAWISYIINSGIYEGLLKRYANFFEDGQQDKIIDLNQKVSSFWLLLLIFISLVASSMALILNLYYLSAILLLSFATVSFNIYSSRYRVVSNILRISSIQLVRLAVSLSLTYILIKNTNLSLDIILFIDALVLCIISMLIFSPSFIATLNFKFFIKDYFEISSTAISLTYVSGLRALCLLLERQSASFLFEDEMFSQYAQILLLFQAAIVGFGLIPQLWQQNIIYWTIRNGVQKSLVMQSCFILLLLFLWIILWTVLHSISFNNPFKETMIVILIIGCAGIVYGASFIDSILLGTKKVQGLVQVYICTVISWLIAMAIFTSTYQSWSLEYQASSLFLLCLIIIIIPGLYVNWKSRADKSIN